METSVAVTRKKTEVHAGVCVWGGGGGEGGGGVI